MSFVHVLIRTNWCPTPLQSSTRSKNKNGWSALHKHNVALNSTYLHRFHVQHFCDAALHNQEIWIVYIHLNGTEQVGNSFIQHRSSIDEILIFAATDTNLPGDRNLSAIFIANRAIIGIGVIKHNGHRCFCDASLSIFENQLLQRCRSNLMQAEKVRNFKYTHYANADTDEFHSKCQ